MDWNRLTDSFTALGARAARRLDDAAVAIFAVAIGLAQTASIELRLDGSLRDVLIRDARIALLRDLSDPESDLALCLMVYR